MRQAVFRGPAPLSSIFSPKVLNGREFRNDPDLAGALGGGFSFFPGVDTTVSVGEGRGLEITVNDEKASFPPSEKAVEVVRELTGFQGFISISHVMHVPIATGFGTSAAAAFAVIMSVSHLLGKPITVREALKHTHRVEIACKTGLNSEAGFGKSGLVLVVREGGPEHAVVDQIPLPSGTKLVAVVADRIKTSDAIASVERLQLLERIGDQYMEKILKNPTPENFFAQSREFAEKTGFADETVHQIFKIFEKLPTIGYAQNMVGKAVHALIHEENTEQVVQKLKQSFPQYRVFVGSTSSSTTLTIT
ncbi:MAG: hypothetical protein QXF45_06615 [Candidatus Caldarchaeum sp.]